MRGNSGFPPNRENPQRQPHGGIVLPPMQRKVVVGLIMLIALFSFEIFNFDTTRYALANLLGGVRFMGVQWATVLAIAFCAIDFAGLARLFTPQPGHEEPQAVWYLMGAWLLGATMNAVMTWWAVSLTLLNHEFGNEILSREQLLQYVPFFVATLVWLTRILFIGAFSVAGEHIFDLAGTAVSPTQRPSAQPQPTAITNPQPTQQPSRIDRRPRQTPPVGSTIRRSPVGMQARKRR